MRAGRNERGDAVEERKERNEKKEKREEGPTPSAGTSEVGQGSL